MSKDITSNNYSDKYSIGIEATPELLEHLRKIQKEHPIRYTNKQVAAALGITEYVYKNILSGKNKIIPSNVINGLATLYGYTRDYVRGESQAHNLNSDGSEMTFPLDFSEANKQVTAITNFLYSDYRTLNNLYLLLYKLPVTIRDDLLTSFNTICENIRITSLMERKDELTDEKFEYILENLVSDNPELTKMTLKLAEANAHAGKKRKKEALHLYLEIVYYATYDSRSAVKEAISKINAFQNAWSKFPKELAALPKHLSTLLTAKNSFEYNLSMEAEKIIQEYLQSQNIKLTNRQEYITNILYN